MIANIFLIVVCTIIIGFIIYGIYKKKYDTNIKPDNKNYDIPKDDLFIDKLTSDQVEAFHKLFTSNNSNSIVSS
ncbi:IMV membrane protein, virion maturation [Eptesipox virus]|uniref:IMV membrane protein, virion maturation n=1 Tax=Eptesipox virus TaxID=1329402 RepID=A0A220T6H1_9POXV|nr:IMV membrane protein, virion maturation [Eptesipox virus]ASK51310.1 IMV membrane protein, virion maturation [Eptesipox virus]WAH71068.1 IMV membrane protein, virion maturation [Eptesipox virus]